MKRQKLPFKHRARYNRRCDFCGKNILKGNFVYEGQGQTEGNAYHKSCWERRFL